MSTFWEELVVSGECKGEDWFICEFWGDILGLYTVFIGIFVVIEKSKNSEFEAKIGYIRGVWEGYIG